jgi:hypothetical protein
MNSATFVARAEQESRQSLTDRILESLSVDRHHGLRETLAAELENSLGASRSPSASDWSMSKS